VYAQEKWHLDWHVDTQIPTMFDVFSEYLQKFKNKLYLIIDLLMAAWLLGKESVFGID
ncbi:hypothetical protein ACJX0J_032177, partial [Zea mays]